MKRWISVILVLTIAAALAACGNTSTDTTATTAVPTTISSNPLLAANLQHGYVRSGSNEVIGQYAYIHISKSTLKEITIDDYREFCETVVSHIIYKWVSIICDDGTGIQFTGAQYTIATYGTINYEGIIIQEIGNINQTSNGFEYKKCE